MKVTVDDWIERASKAKTEPESVQCVESAVKLAESCREWRVIVRGFAVIPCERNLIAQVCQRALEESITAGEVWGFRDVAVARALHLGDMQGASQALEAAFTTFRVVPLAMSG